MIRTLITLIFVIPLTSAHVETYNYICKVGGKSLPLKVNDTKNILEWKGTTYKIRTNEECAKFGWRAEKDGNFFDFCTATQGYADFQQNGSNVQCDLARR